MNKTMATVIIFLLISTLFLLSCSNTIEQNSEVNAKPYAGESANVIEHSEPTNVLEPESEINVEEKTDSDVNSPYGLDESFEPDMFLDLPVSQGQHDLLRIIQQGQHGITWETPQYPAGPAESGWVDITYAVFDAFPNAEVTDTVNQYIRDFALRLYYNYLEDNENREQDEYFRYPGHFVSGVNVLFANPQLVSIHIWTSVTFRRPWDDDITLNFNPTTGERYLLENFVDITPEFMVVALGQRMAECESTLYGFMNFIRYWALTFSEDGIGIIRATDGTIFDLTYEDLAPFLFTND